MNCRVCGEEIPVERLEALPDTQTCVRCSTVKPKLVLPVYSHKTAPGIMVIDTDNPEAVRLAMRAHRRGR